MLKSVARPASPIVLAQSGAVVSHTGTTGEVTLVTVAVPGNLLNANTTIDCECIK